MTVAMMVMMVVTMMVIEVLMMMITSRSSTAGKRMELGSRGRRKSFFHLFLTPTTSAEQWVSVHRQRSSRVGR